MIIAARQTQPRMATIAAGDDFVFDFRFVLLAVGEEGIDEGRVSLAVAPPVTLVRSIAQIGRAHV